MRAARVQAQAKVNLFLIVRPRRDDGFHDIQTLFQRIDLADDITVRVGVDGRSLDVAGPFVPAGGLGPAEQNLAYRAAVEYGRMLGGDFGRGFSIELTKNIPVGAGLGGGSADAGAVLRALNAIAPEPLPADMLLEMAGRLGSDVPFLASERVNALAEGRGEILLDEPSRPSQPCETLVVVPPFGIATADAYRWLDEDRAADPTMGVGPAMRDAEEPSRYLKPNEWAYSFRSTPGNSFEPSIERRHPELRQIRERLMESGAEMARLAGSGSCVFAIYRDRAPDAATLGLDARIIRTRTSARVVEVEVLQ